MAIHRRKIGPFDVECIGLGCMNLSHAYSSPPPIEDARALLIEAFDLGVRHFDTAALYGFGKNEELVGPTLKPFRDEILLASKCGMTGVDGKRVIDGRPETILKTCDEALKRLQTDWIDLYYLHRWDRKVPIEESVGALKRLVEAGKVRAIGLSEVSAETLRKAAKVHPVAALQTEYSLWTRNPEIAVLKACEELGTAFVAFSPLARGFLGGSLRDPSKLEEKDIRRPMPRFQAPNFENNLRRLEVFETLADEAAGVPPAILALNWVLNQGRHIHIVPGTTKLEHLRQNVETDAFDFPEDILQRAGEIFNQRTVSGPRYPAAVQVEIDTEEF
jgi:aryl-alcohol dehydrogenase-like predicted oxidoreductase